jgi:hypothetical protein
MIAMAPSITVNAVEHEQPDDPHHPAVGQKALDLLGQDGGLAGNHQMEVRGDGVEELTLVDDV